MNIIQLIANNNYIVVNKDLIKEIGLEEAILLGELASEYSYWLKENKLTEDGYFFTTVENIRENTSFLQTKQKNLFKRLEEIGLIQIKLMGLPAKRYIRINEEELNNLFVKKK